MQWGDKDTYLDVTEATHENKIAISMWQTEDQVNGNYIELDKINAIRLRDWLNEGIKELQE